MMSEHDETPYPFRLPEGVPGSDLYRPNVVQDVLDERERQDRRWGVSRNLHPSLWLAVLSEEMGEMAEAILKGDRDNYRRELVQVAAVALAALQDWRWQQEFRDRLPAPQVVPFAWERAGGRKL